MNALHKLSGYCLTCSGVLIGTILSGPLVEDARAQGRTTLEEIVVTATKRDTALQDAPITVSVFTDDDVERQQIVRPKDFIGQVANVSLATAVRPGESNVSMRGIQGNFGLTQPVAVVVDGVVAANPNALDQELVGVRQIEVVKGPQSALYGRNANAGAIVISTRRPSQQVEGKLLVGVGNGDAVRAQGLLSGPLTDKLVGRLAVSHNERDGFWDNNTLDRPQDVHEQRIVDGRVIYEPSDVLSIDLRFKASELKIGTQLWSVQVPPFIPFTNNDYFPDFQTNIDSTGEQERYDYSAKIDYQLPFATLTAIGSYDDYETNYTADGAFHTIFPGGPPTIFVNPGALLNANPPALPGYSYLTGDGSAYAERNQHDGTLELRLTSHSAQRLRWFFGGYYAYSERTDYADTRADTGSGVTRQILGRALLPTSPDPIISVGRYTTNEITNVAAFGQLEYDLTDQLTFEISLRYDKEEVENLNRIPAVNSPVTGAPLTDPLVAPSGQLREDEFTEWQPRVSLRYEPFDELTVFASYGRGFRSGGFNPSGIGARVQLQAPNTNFPDVFPAETSDAYEVGFKSQWLDKRLSLDGAVFYTEIEDAQAFTAFPSPPLTLVISLEEVRAYGAEVDISYQVTDNLRLSNSFGFTDTEIENTPLTTAIGKTVPGTPEYTNSFNVDYDRPFNFMDMRLTLVAHFDWQQIGPMWFDVYNTPRTEREAFSLFNTRVAIEGTHQGNTWQIAGWAKNLGDEFWNVYAAPVPPLANFSYRAAPRSFGVDFVYKF